MSIFSPPLSTQRYCWVQDFITQEPSIKTVTDVGCAQGRLLIWLKNIANLELVNFIDQSLHTLEDGIDSCFQPNLCEMLFGRKKSEKQLDIKVYHGDIVVPDDRLQADCFTMIEVIEHIPLEQLEKICQTVFGYYKPRFIIVTTPNVEFNHLLEAHAAQERARRAASEPIKAAELNASADNHIISTTTTTTIGEMGKLNELNKLKRFRHYDHKFEWNRQEFANWVDVMCKTYSYEAHLSGVGELPGSQSFGHCTQIALFRHVERVISSDHQQQPINDPMLCFDLLLNKLCVGDEQPEFMGDTSLRRVCLRAEFHIPGTRRSSFVEPTYSGNWTDEVDEEMETNQQWPSSIQTLPTSQMGLDTTR